MFDRLRKKKAERRREKARTAELERDLGDLAEERLVLGHSFRP
jgi:hypothetical protein